MKRLIPVLILLLLTTVGCSHRQAFEIRSISDISVSPFSSPATLSVTFGLNSPAPYKIAIAELNVKSAAFTATTSKPIIVSKEQQTVTVTFDMKLDLSKLRLDKPLPVTIEAIGSIAGGKQRSYRVTHHISKQDLEKALKSII